MKDQPQIREEIFAKYVPDKGLVSKHILIKGTYVTRKLPVKKRAKGPEQTPHQRFTRSTHEDP